VEDALRPYKARIDRAPITPPYVVAAIHDDPRDG